MNSMNPKAISALESMKKQLDQIYYVGNLSLLSKPKVSIVGSRKPSVYTKQMTHDIASALVNRGVVIVSGAAMGVDAVAHKGAGATNTIAVLPCGTDICYPAVNKDLIEEIQRQGLLISQFKAGFQATSWSFVLRNEVVVALGDVLVVTESDINSGSMRSVEYALNMGKDIYVLTHRLGESNGTNELLTKGLAKPIYNIENFAEMFGVATEYNVVKDEFYYFCQQHPTLDSAIERFGDRVYEAELEGIIQINSGIVSLS